MTVAEARTLPDDTKVILTGNVMQSLGRERYLFRDHTGDITVEIERKVWRGLSVGVDDAIEIRGELKIEVKSIMKL